MRTDECRQPAISIIFLAVILFLSSCTFSDIRSPSSGNSNSKAEIQKTKEETYKQKKREAAKRTIEIYDEILEN